ncbi:MAG: GNAT family N-acetyltransferase [Pseudolysinimonas sp.]|uniref:GNAT family N-acetyltransferase n=1 Tax=Pseudolysinimonas sp. TaxID=2680009 RepID=UPI0032654640
MDVETPDAVVEVKPALGRYDDFYEVVGVKKPGGGGCWCMSYRDSRVPNDQRGAYMERECATSPGPGVLAYVDGEVAGWCSVAPRSTYRRLMNSRTIPFLDERDAWSIVCFVVRAGYRKRGLMHVLLEGAVEHARANGAEIVEGYPIETGGDRVDVISGYVGTTELFEAAGFTRAAETTAHSGGKERWIMRREF